MFTPVRHVQEAFLLILTASASIGVKNKFYQKENANFQKSYAFTRPVKFNTSGMNFRLLLWLARYDHIYIVIVHYKYI